MTGHIHCFKNNYRNYIDFPPITFLAHLVILTPWQNTPQKLYCAGLAILGVRYQSINLFPQVPIGFIGQFMAPLSQLSATTLLVIVPQHQDQYCSLLSC